MHSINKLPGWIFSIALLASIFSYSGYAHNAAMQQNTRTELVDLKNHKGSTLAYNINAKRSLQAYASSSFSDIDFQYLLNSYNVTCNIKFATQKRTILNANNYFSTNELRIISPLNTDTYNNIFIG